MITFLAESAIPQVIAIVLGLAAWGLPILGRIRNRTLSAASWCCCAVALWIPVLYLYAEVRTGDMAAVEDCIWAYVLAETVLLIGTSFANLVFCRRKHNS